MFHHRFVPALAVLFLIGLAIGCQRSPAPQVKEETYPAPAPVAATPMQQTPVQPHVQPAEATEAPANNRVPEPPAAVKEVVQRYLEALQKQDIAAMASVAEVPFLDLDRQFIRDRDGLPGVLQRLAEQWPKESAIPDVSYNHYSEEDDRGDDELTQQVFADALNDNDWFVTLWFDVFRRFTIFVKVTDAKAAIVGGPLKPNQIGKAPQIPEPASSALTEAESMVLYSLNPDGLAKASKDQTKFHGWIVLGTTEIRDASTREKMVTALRQATAENPGVAAGCFQPRHGLRLVKGDQTVDLVICFECLSAQIYADDKAVGGFLTMSDPQAAFNAPLKAAGIPIVPNYHEKESPLPDPAEAKPPAPAKPGPAVPAVDPFG